MWPVLYEHHGATGTIPLNTYGLFMLLAFCAAFGYVHVFVRKAGIHPDKLLPVYVASAVSGLVGARILFIIAVEPDPLSALFSFSGFAFYGGVIGGTLGVYAMAVMQKIPKWKLADIAAPAVVLGLGVGRMGCFFAGCCHGALAPTASEPTALLPNGLLQGQIWLQSSFPWITTEFHAGVGRLLHAPLYPTQLWSIAAGLLIVALLTVVWFNRRFDGQVAAAGLIIEPVFRITIESFRADHRGMVLSWEGEIPWLPGLSQAGSELGTTLVGITTSQGIGLAMIVLGLAIIAVQFSAGVAPEVPLEEEY